MKCIYCEQEINPEERKIMLPIDRPIYVNLNFHLECYQKIKGDERKYLTENWDKITKFLDGDFVKIKRK